MVVAVVARRGTVKLELVGHVLEKCSGIGVTYAPLLVLSGYV